MVVHKFGIDIGNVLNQINLDSTKYLTSSISILFRNIEVGNKADGLFTSGKALDTV